MSQTDTELVRAALSGNQDACRALVARHQHAVYNLALRLLRDPAAAEDVAQDTFLKTFQRLHTFDTSRRLTPWLLRIAHNTAIDVLRRRVPPAASLLNDPVDGSASTAAEADLERRELRDALSDGIGALRPQYRAAIVLRYQHELSYAEVADVMGVPVGTAKTYVHRARRDLAERLRTGGWR